MGINSFDGSSLQVGVRVLSINFWNVQRAPWRTVITPCNTQQKDTLVAGAFPR